MYSKTLWSKKKEYDCYFVREKLFRSYLERETMDPCYLEFQKCISQLFGASKKRMTAISIQKTGLQLFGARNKWIPAIWMLKKLVHSYFES